MNEGITTILALLKEVEAHMSTNRLTDKRLAVEKLQRLASIATTLAFTIQLTKPAPPSSRCSPSHTRRRVIKLP
jgi:hypothetical protein